jgi:hypothetical protein
MAVVKPSLNDIIDSFGPICSCFEAFSGEADGVGGEKQWSLCRFIDFCTEKEILTTPQWKAYHVT